MAFTRKPGPAQAISLVGQIPDPPSLPAKTLERFPELVLYQTETERWWAEVSVLLQRDLDQITARFQADEALITDLTARVAALEAAP